MIREAVGAGLHVQPYKLQQYLGIDGLTQSDMSLCDQNILEIIFTNDQLKNILHRACTMSQVHDSWRYQDLLSPLSTIKEGLIKYIPPFKIYTRAFYLKVTNPADHRRRIPSGAAFHGSIFHRMCYKEVDHRSCNSMDIRESGRPFLSAKCFVKSQKFFVEEYLIRD
jgi:hypothetical protein